MIRAKDLHGKNTGDAENRGIERKYTEILAARMKKQH
jgi:hypothetical protein